MNRRAMLIILAVLSAAPLSRAHAIFSLEKLYEIPGVSGYEQSLSSEIRNQLKEFSPKTDNLGNVYVTLGSGAPHRLIVAPMDAPGYVVSGITPDGYLRLQRLPQAPPPREYVERVIQLARDNNIPVQYGVTGGGNDGAVFQRYGSVDIPLGWPLRYSHSPGEVIDTRDVDALAKIIAVLAKNW